MAVALALANASLSTPAQANPKPAPASASAADNTPKWPQLYPTGDTTQLGARIAELLREPAVARAHWGIAVTAMDGTPIYGLDEGKLFRPASTAKLFTTATAIAILGPDYTRFTTRVYGDRRSQRHSSPATSCSSATATPRFGTTDLPCQAPTLRAATRPLILASPRRSALSLRGVHHVMSRRHHRRHRRALRHVGPLPEGWAARGHALGLRCAPQRPSRSPTTNCKLTSHAHRSRPTGHGRELSPAVTSTSVPYAECNPCSPAHHPYRPANRHRPSRTTPRRTIYVSGNIASGARPYVEHLAIEDPAACTPQSRFKTALLRDAASRSTARHTHPARVTEPAPPSCFAPRGSETDPGVA